MTDREQLSNLYRQCFPEDDASFWEWIFERVYRPENTLVTRVAGKIVASLQMIPCKMRLKDRLFDAHYIYAAATLPDMRGRGLMGELLTQAAEEGLRRGHAFSVLITQEDSLQAYYARFGYQNKCLLSLHPPTGVQSRIDCNCRSAVTADIPAISSIYERETAHLLCGHREETFWLQQLDLFGKGASVLECDGVVTAYAFADERGVIEAGGEDAERLAACIAPAQPWRTFPTANSKPIGSIRPLNEEARILMEQNPCYLNLMYN